VLNLLCGIELKMNESDFNQMIEISNIFNFDAMKKFICKQLPAPQSFEESIKYIKQSTQFSYQKHLNRAISIAAQQFKNIEFSIINNLAHSILSQIINSTELII
jgi:hypothetical protein